MKHLIGWHRLYEIFVEIKDNIDLDVRLGASHNYHNNEFLQALPRCDILAYLPDVALIWRFSIIREIVLSGFQLELYLGDEIPFAYWYAAKITDEHLRSLDCISSTAVHGMTFFRLLFKLKIFASVGSEAYREMSFQFKFLTLMQSLCTSLFVVCSFPLELLPFLMQSFRLPSL